MRQTVLQTRNLTKRYGKTTAVNNVSLEIKKGDVYGLIGQNGAGKTTFMRIITQLAQHSSGNLALWGDSSQTGLNRARRRIGSVIETPALYPNLTALQNLEYYRIQRGVTDKNSVTNALKTVNLTDTGKKKFKNFSLGMKQRLGLALSLLGSPDFIILDEPINGLDPIGIVEMREMLKKLNTQLGITFLISSHILSELSLIATRYGFIHNGSLIKELTDEELRDECQRCLSIKVNDISKAAVVLETQLKTTKFKTVGLDEIRLYDLFDNPALVNFQLNNNGVRVSAISEIGDNLEDYFVTLINNAEKGVK